MSRWGKGVLVVLGLFMLSTAIAGCSGKTQTATSKITIPTAPSQVKKPVNQTNTVNRLSVTLTDVTIDKTRVTIGIALKNQSADHPLDFFPEKGSVVIDGMEIEANPSASHGSVSGTIQPGAEKTGKLVFLVPKGKTLSPGKIAQITVRLGNVIDNAYLELSPFNTTLTINKDLLAEQKKEIKNPACIEYAIKSGDTLYAIALKYNTTMDQLKKLNGIDSKGEKRLAIGRIIRIPTKMELSAREIVKGPASAKKVALTFDAGSGSGATPQILKALENAKVKATFFLTGKWVEKNSEIAKRIAEGENLIGNNTDTYPNLTKLTDRKIAKELKSAEDKIHGKTGVSSKPLFRAPDGMRNPRVLKVVANAGYRPVYWTVDSLDWKRSMTAKQVKNRILAGLNNGAIIRLHCDSKQTAQILPDLVKEIQDKGYKIVTIPELFE